MPTRPRYPLEFTLFENEYPEFDDDLIERAMAVMDKGYMDQDYYKSENRMIKLKGDRKETFDYDSYGWTEHISRKWGQWYPQLEPLKNQFKKRGFDF